MALYLSDQDKYKLLQINENIFFLVVGKKINCGAMEPENLQNLPGYHARARLVVTTLVCLRAEKLILVIIHQFLHRKAKINMNKLHVSPIQLSISRFLGEPAPFNRPGFPVDRFSIFQKDFFNKTNNMSKVFFGDPVPGLNVVQMSSYFIHTFYLSK
jgi:hypothetical protein